MSVLALPLKLATLRPFWDRLGPRHRQLVEMRAAGKTAPEIAKELRLARSTVYGMMSEARRRLEMERDKSGAPVDPDALPPWVTAAEDEQTIDPPMGVEPEFDDGREPSPEPSVGGFSKRAGLGSNYDTSKHTPGARKKLLPPLIRNDPPDHPVIVDVGGVEVVALEVGPATKTTTRVRWQSRPGSWASEVAEVPRATVLRDATECEIAGDMSIEPDEDDRAEAAAG